MKEIRLTGKYATGSNAVALVDDADFERLVAHAWKAKPNGNGTHVYAVRNAVVDGRNVTIRMHREVLCYAGALDVRFWNGNRLDNQRRNLLVVPRGTNVTNPDTASKRGEVPSHRKQPRARATPAQRVWPTIGCDICACQFVQRRKSHVHCSGQCREKAKRSSIVRRSCAACGCAYQPRRHLQVTCTTRCKQALRRHNTQKSQGPLTGSHARVRNDLELESARTPAQSELFSEREAAK